MTRLLFVLLTTCLLLPLESSAQKLPTLLDYTWSVGVCKTKMKKDCEDLRKPNPDTTFGVIRNSDNNYWLKVRFPAPEMKISIPVDSIKEHVDEDGVPFVTFEFWDFSDTGGKARKKMRIEWVRQNGNQLGQECSDKLNHRLGDGFETGGDHAEQCQKDNLVYWSIDTLYTRSGDGGGDINVRGLGPPGDGQGTGSDEPPEPSNPNQ